MQEHILITGCAGFIGGHVLDRLLSQGHLVTGVDDLSTGRRDNMAKSWGQFRFIEGSLCDSAVAREAVSGVDRIVHFASVPSVPRSLENPLESAHASVIGTVTLLDAAVRAGVRRLVQSTSSSAYGDCEVLPRIETLSPSPLSPYAVAKLTQEHYAAAFQKCYGLDTVSLRLFNVFGPRQNPASKYAAVIPRFITRLRQGQPPEIYGDGGQTRDFTYIANVVDAVVLALFEEKPLRGQVANIGAGAGHSLNELVEVLNALLGTQCWPVYHPARVGDVRHSLADIGKAHRLFGYTPRVDFADGLRLTVDAFRHDATG